MNDLNPEIIKAVFGHKDYQSTDTDMIDKETDQRPRMMTSEHLQNSVFAICGMLVVFFLMCSALGGCYVSGYWNAEMTKEMKRPEMKNSFTPFNQVLFPVETHKEQEAPVK